MSSRKSLEDLGLSPTILTKLREAGYKTLESLAVANVSELANITGIPLPTAHRIVSKARELLGLTLKTALDLKKEKGTLPKITTGSKRLDGLLGGGVETGTITEFFGEYGTGKTQLCLQLSVNVQLPRDRGGLEARAIFIDAEGTFRWERIEAMAKAVGLDPEKAMSNIYWIRAISSDHQMAVV
ncbi:MAG: helix-hairpin-helix domain-containing protein, partial [Sulfolobales archaeon]|nr:helix-hairpin-helix domain-containing protein [Sulfolobales archaeon]MDW8010076.1 helix-hairpin-helix domain-containing protein [Sulfolobales archaeon]